MSGALPAASLEGVATPSTGEVVRSPGSVQTAPRGNLPEPATDPCGWTTGDRVFLWASLVVAATLLGVQVVRDTQRRGETVTVSHSETQLTAVEHPPVTPLLAAQPGRHEAALFRVEINSADWQRWMQLPGIGETLARRIVVDRQEHGPFQSIEDLNRVRGIGPKTLERLRPFLVNGPVPEMTLPSAAQVRVAE